MQLVILTTSHKRLSPLKTQKNIHLRKNGQHYIAQSKNLYKTGAFNNKNE